MTAPSIIELKSVITKIEANLVDQSANQQIDDAAFVARLERALIKNFNYIVRKDSGLALESVDVPSSSVGGITNSSQHLAAAAKAEKFSGPVNGNKMNANPSIPQTKLGIGGSQPVTECKSVYVSGLPLDFTEEEIGILFGSTGKIKKVKMYVDKDGNKKGDALVTFAGPEFVSVCCVKLHNMDIGDGYIISVVRADFNEKSKKNDNKMMESKQDTFDQEESLFRRILPRETELDTFPVLIIHHVFDATQCKNEAELDELKADILMECCIHGNVRLLQILSPTLQSPCDFRKVHGLTENEIAKVEGCVAVTFETAENAKSCAKALEGRFFDGKKLHAKVILPRNASPTLTESFVALPTAHVIPPPPQPPQFIRDSNYTSSSSTPLPPPPPIFSNRQNSSSTYSIVQQDNVVMQIISCKPCVLNSELKQDSPGINKKRRGEEESEDFSTEDFLNSLL